MKQTGEPCVKCVLEEIILKDDSRGRTETTDFLLASDVGGIALLWKERIVGYQFG
jgi:hypothetical protein